MKNYLLNNKDNLVKAIESYGFHSVWFGEDEIRCATPEGTNKTAVSIKLNEGMYAVSYSDNLNYRGDILGLLQEVSKTSFVNVMRRLHGLFGMEYDGKKPVKKIDLLKDIRRFRKGNRVDRENKKFDSSIMNGYVHIPHKNLIEEAITPDVIKQFGVAFDPEKSRILFPHYSWDCDGTIVGIQGRHTESSFVLKELSIPKYWNYLQGYIKSRNIYGWSHAEPNLKDSKMLIIFEGEKSTLKQFSMEKGKGYAVSLGSHELSDEQEKFILKNTDVDTEIVIAFDKDIMDTTIEDHKTGEKKHFLTETCKRFSGFRKVSYIKDPYNLLEEKDSPIDKGIKVWKALLSIRENVK